MKHLLSRFHRDEQGTSLTEFVLGLPIMITIMSGILALYHINQDALEVNGEANRKVWAASLPSQSETRLLQMTPLTGAISNVQDVFSSGSLSGGINSFGADPLGGLYAESYLKTQLANTLFDVGVDPEFTTQRIMDPNEKYAAAVSLSDQPGLPSGGGGVEGVLSGILSVGGARPGLAGGIRYGVTTDTGVTRNESYNGVSRELTAKYKLPFPTKPTNRTFAMAIAKLDMNAHPESDARKAYRKAILPFKMVPEIITGDYPGVPTQEEIDSLTEQCKEDPDSCPSNEEDAQVFHDKMDCYKEAAVAGGDGANC